MKKSTVDEIRARFDKDVERFSQLETGQVAAMDSAFCMGLIAETAAAVSPQAKDLLDIGCGAGNYTLKLLERIPGLNVTLLDLSLPMLERAKARVSAAGGKVVATLQADVREVDLGEARFDTILAAAVLHHLRDESEWRAVFAKLYRALKPGGALWIYDMVAHELPAVQTLQSEAYGQYLEDLNGKEYRATVFAYTEKEDTPRPVTFQIEQLRAAGFRTVELLHKRGPFAAFGALK